MVLDLSLRHSVLRALPAAHPQPRKVAAWTATLGLHAAVLLLLMAPQQPFAPLPVEDVAPDRTIIWIEPELPLEVPLLPEPVPQRPQPARLAPELPSPLPPLPQPIALPEPAWPVPSEALPPAPSPAGNMAGPVGQSEAVAVARVTPPAYPGPALRRGLEGTVELLVLVDSDGRPVQVDIAASSGHRELDRAARAHVLAEWRFHPALRNGRPVSAVARVPIAFRIER